MATHVTLDKNGAVYTIAFSEDVERHPCTLDWDVLTELERCIAEVRDSQACRVVIVESRSPKSFVVGANLAVLKTQDETNIGDWVKNGHRIFNQLQHLPHGQHVTPPLKIPSYSTISAEEKQGEPQVNISEEYRKSGKYF